LKVVILAVGNRMPRWVKDGYAEFATRLPPELKSELIEIRSEERSRGRTLGQILEAERIRLEAACPPAAQRIVLDERGELWSTRQFAQTLDAARQLGQDLAFFIGGPDGLHPQLKQRAQALMALSRMTLPHSLVRVLLAEQLYRAVTILHNHPYHRSKQV
jgi:23S rRNA (pseudouridine1915-N3)-methyltransferase